MQCPHSPQPLAGSRSGGRRGVRDPRPWPPLRKGCLAACGARPHAGAACAAARRRFSAWLHSASRAARPKAPAPSPRAGALAALHWQRVLSALPAPLVGAGALAAQARGGRPSRFNSAALCASAVTGHRSSGSPCCLWETEWREAKLRAVLVRPAARKDCAHAPVEVGPPPVGGALVGT